ncbi:DUF2024 family protein [Arenimonas caeni]|nr:DUF2024 family protein [Arenimonas caeni]
MAMKIAVFDTHVLRSDGRRMHFDILVQDEPADRDMDKVLAHGRRYLDDKGVTAMSLTAHECRFCHVEQARPEVEQTIRERGFAILEMEGCGNP